MNKVVAVLLAVVVSLGFAGTAFAGSLSGGGINQPIGKDEALSIALRDAGLSKGKVCKIETEQGKKCLEVEFTKKSTRTEYDYSIAKNGGAILEKSVEYNYKSSSSKAKIGKKAALKKVAKHSGIKLSVIKKGTCTYKYRKNEGTYKVTFHYKGYRYEYKLLAPNGKVLEWEMERSGR